MARYIQNALTLLADPDINLRKRGVQLLDTVPNLNTVLAINYSNPEQLSTQAIKKAMDVLGNYDEMSYYAYLTQALQSNDNFKREAALKYLRGDSRVPSVVLDSITNNGTSLITDEQRVNLNDMIKQTIQGEKRREKERINSGNYSTSYSENKYSLGRGMEIDDDVINVTNTATPQLTYYDKPYEAISSVANSIINSPSGVTTEYIINEANSIYQSFERKYGSQAVAINRETISSIFNTFRSIAPTVNNAQGSDVDTVKRQIGQVLLDCRNGQLQSALVGLTNILTSFNGALITAVRESSEKDKMLTIMNKAGFGLQNQIGQLQNTVAEQSNAFMDLAVRFDEQGRQLRETVFNIEEQKNQITGLQTLLNEEKQKSVVLSERYAAENQIYVATLQRTQAEKEEVQRESMKKYNELLDKTIDEQNRNRATIANIQLELNAAKTKLAENEDEKKKILKEVEQIVGTKASLGEAVGTMIQVGNQLASKANACNDQRLQLQELVDNLKDKQSRKEEEIQALLNEAKVNRETLLSKEQEINKVRSTLQESTNKLAILQDQQKRTNEQLNSSNRVITDLKNKLNSSAVKSTETINSLKSELESAQANYARTFQSLLGLNKEVDSLTTEKDKLETTIRDYDNRLSLANDEISSLNGRIEEYSSLVSTLNEAIETAKRLNDAQQLQITQLQSENSRLASDLNQLNGINEQYLIAKAQAENNGKLLEESKKREEEIKRLKTNEETARKRVEESKKKLEEDNKRKVDELVKMNQQLTKIKKDESEIRALYQQLVEERQNDPMEDLVVNLVEPAPLPQPIMEEIINVAQEQANRRPIQLLQREDVVPAAIPAPQPIVVDQNKKRKLKVEKVESLFSSKRAKVSRARNQGAAGGYVVGGRPDPNIVPGATKFWKNVYRNNYHLF